MATESKCDFCTAVLEKNATLVHTERKPALWDLDYSMCPDCFKQFKAMLEKVKNQKTWAGWTAVERDAASLKKENESLKSELRFLRQNDPTGDQFFQSEPDDKLLKVTSGGETMKAHRSILISRSAVLKTVLTSDDIKRQQRRHPHEPIKLPCVPTHADSFSAFIDFLYTAELKPEILKDHAPELMEAGNKNAIELLTRKCEDYMVNNMTAENTINYLIVGKQCNSKAITAAALKQIQSNPTGFANREDFQTLWKNNPAALAEAFQQMLLSPSKKPAKEKKPKAAKGDSDPDSDTKPQRYLGACTCSVHPFAHTPAPGFQFQGMHFPAATAMSSTGYFANPASILDR